MSKLNEVERQRLAEAVWQMEQVLNGHSASKGAVTSMLVNFVAGAKERIAALDAEIHAEMVEKKEREERLQADVVYLAERETALTQHEREQYAGFLSREFFTTQDFGALSDFYSSAWDRLSEDGKAQMSHRVWEGVRREEYQFSELPENVKEKEAARLRDMLTVSKITPDLNNIPETDRSDFTNAWDGGQKRRAYEVLDRKCFAENVALTAEAATSKASVGERQETSRAALRDGLSGVQVSSDTQPPAEAKPIGAVSDMVLSNDLLGKLETGTKPTELTVKPSGGPVHLPSH